MDIRPSATRTTSPLEPTLLSPREKWRQRAVGHRFLSTTRNRHGRFTTLKRSSWRSGCSLSLSLSPSSSSSTYFSLLFPFLFRLCEMILFNTKKASSGSDEPESDTSRQQTMSFIFPDVFDLSPNKRKQSTAADSI